MKKLLLLPIFFLGITKDFAQTGCTDPQATNYNAAATINDGSCVYASTNLSLQLKANLATPTLDESSGIEFIANSLWTHNDSGNSPTLYRVDSTNGSILQSVVISNATNVDWEDMTSGPDFVYIGDFGNNNGNRTNLKIYRVAKSDLTPGATSVTAGIINFTYSDQTSFVSAPNNNNFDCESVIFYNDSLHLFSKNWVDKQSRHYVLPATPGTYIAQVKETLNAGNLITGASVQEGGVIALIGYDNTGIAPVFMWMLYDFHDGLFYNGNKRKFNVSSAIVNGQTEAVDFKNGAYGYVSNERFIQNPFNVAPAIRSFNLAPYLPSWFVNPPPVAAFSVSNDTICKGNSVSFTDQSVLNPVTWNWSFPGGTPASSNLQNPVVTYSTAGSYNVTLLVSNSTGAVDTLVKNNFVTVMGTPVSVATANGPVVFCTGGSVLLSANTGVGLSYQWKKSGSNINGATSSSYLATATGTYKVIVTNAGGCTKLSAGIVVTGPPVASMTPAGQITFCAGDSAILTASNGAGYTYQWKRNGVTLNGATGISYTAKTQGTYKVVVTNPFGCSKTSGGKKVTVNCKTGESMIQADAADLSLTVYPNPADDEITVFSLNKIDKAELFDVLGKSIPLTGMVKNSVEEGSLVIDIHTLKSGIYFIRVNSGMELKAIRFTKF